MDAKNLPKRWFPRSKPLIIRPSYMTKLISVKRKITNISDRLKAGSSLAITKIIFYFDHE